MQWNQLKTKDPVTEPSVLSSTPPRCIQSMHALAGVHFTTIRVTSWKMTGNEYFTKIKNPHFYIKGVPAVSPRDIFGK